MLDIEVTPEADSWHVQGFKVSMEPDPPFPPYMRIESPDGTISVLIDKDAAHHLILAMLKEREAE